MKHILQATIVALGCLFFSHSAPADSSRVVSFEDAIAMMNALPKKETDGPTAPSYRWSRVGQANRVAEAISRHAGTSEQGAWLAVQSVFEANNRLDAVGDGGKSHGPFQLSVERTTPDVARDPDRAAPIWLSLADLSRKTCANLPEDEQMAAVMSGNCDHGRKLARRRAALVRRALGALAQKTDTDHNVTGVE
jgi:hypothetical protein